MVETTAKTFRYKSYKDSGVELLGEIPDHWEVLPLFALTKLKSIKNQVNLELLSVYLDLGVIRFSDVVAKRTNVTSLDLSKYQLVEPGDFVLNNQQAWRGSVGVSNYKGIVSPAYIVLSLNEKLNPFYANYLFRDSTMVSQYLVNSKGVGTIQRNLYWPSLRRSNISLPPLQEQTAIAQFLDDKTTKIDEAISIKEQQINLLKERKQILIHKAVTRGLDDNVKLKDSGVAWIGEIPEHWELSRLGLMLTPYSVKNHPKETLLSVTRELGVIKRDLEDFETNHNFIPEDLSGYKLIEKGDFGMNKMKAWQGSYGVSKFKGIISPAYFTFKLVKTINPDFFHLAIRSKIYVPFFGQASDGVRIGQWDLSKDRMKMIPFVIPSLKEQTEILDYIEVSTNKIETAIGLKQQEIFKLKEYKSSLINSVVTGKLKVC